MCASERAAACPHPEVDATSPVGVLPDRIGCGAIASACADPQAAALGAGAGSAQSGHNAGDTSRKYRPGYLESVTRHGGLRAARNPAARRARRCGRSIRRTTDVPVTTGRP
jgi:hypothetical protein